MYVESNFVLELTYLQEARDSCSRLLEFAESGRIRLALPAFCATECRISWQSTANKRRRFNDDLQVHIRELSRSEPYADIRDRSRELQLALIEGSEEAKVRLDDTIDRVLRCADIVDLTPDIIRSAIEGESQFSLSAQDSVVFAAVLHHLRSVGEGRKFFVNKNSKDFANPDVEAELARHDCKLHWNFDHAASEITALLR